MLEAVLFDLDGTLLDTSPDFLIATNIMLQRHQRPQLKREVLAPFITNGSAGIIENTFNINRNHPDFKPLWEELLSLYLEHIADETHYYEGMEEVLTHIKQHSLKWGIVTNKPSRFTEPLLTALNIDADCSVCPDHVSEAKPSPEGLFLACSQINVHPENCLYIGDHLRDIKAAKAANMLSVGVTYGFIEKGVDPHQWGGDYVIDSAIELVDIINQRL